MEFKVRKLKNIELNRLSKEAFIRHEKNDLVVILDQVRSMNNVGSAFRTCDCLGVSRLYLGGITPHPPHREIFKTSLGAEESVQWEHIQDTAALIRDLKQEGYLIAALEQTDHSRPITGYDPGGKIALIAGNEVDGVSNPVLELCDVFLEIPQFGTKHSFNVSVSLGIAIWEISKNMGRWNTT